MNNKVKIYLKSKRTIDYELENFETFTSFIKKLNEARFLKIEDNVAINIDKIDTIEKI